MPLCQLPVVELLEYLETGNGPPKRLAATLAGAVQAFMRSRYGTRGMGPSSGLLGGQGSIPLSCAAPSERLSVQFQRHAMRHGILELPNAVINGAFSLLVHLSSSGVLGSAISAPLLASSRSALELHLELAVCHLPSRLQQPAADWPRWTLSQSPLGESLFSLSLSYDRSPVTRRCGGTRGDNRQTLGDGWRQKWAHFAVPVA